jgi:SAM-dependent methyltransferase
MNPSTSEVQEALGKYERPKAAGKSRMEPDYWIPQQASSLLDVGCNTGALLADFSARFPNLQLAGIDINHSAVAKAKSLVPNAEIHQGFGFALPFDSDRFEYVTCIEVMEHIPAADRPRVFFEIRRVLKPGGTFIIRVPHAGIFSWLDAQNFRFRFPRLYGGVVGQGERDVHYLKAQEELVWHHHFTREELLSLAGEGWCLEACQYGGLLLFPITDIVRWPFYRVKRSDHWLVHLMGRIATAELALNFGKRSYGILLVLKKSSL